MNTFFAARSAGLALRKGVVGCRASIQPGHGARPLLWCRYKHKGSAADAPLKIKVHTSNVKPPSNPTESNREGSADVVPNSNGTEEVVKVTTKVNSKKLNHKDTGAKPRNENIPFNHVHFIDPQTGKLSTTSAMSSTPSQIPLSTLLSALDRKQEYLELITSSPFPIVKLVNTKDKYEKKKAMKKKEKEKGEAEKVKRRRGVSKEVQVRWGAAEADVEVKLRKVREELTKGYRVELVALVYKKGGGPNGGGGQRPSKGDVEKKIGGWIKSLEGVGKEWKAREVKGGTTVVHLQGVVDGVGVEKERVEKKERERDDEDDDF